MKLLKACSLAVLIATSPFAVAADRVDLNTADAATLSAAIQGVGDAKAQAIIEYRKKNGPFKSVDDLAMVPGIGEKTVIKNKGRLTVSTPKP